MNFARNFRQAFPLFGIICFLIGSSFDPSVYAETADDKKSDENVKGVSVDSSNLDTLSRERLYRQSLGWIIGEQSGLARLGFNEAELRDVCDGFMRAGAGKPTPTDLRLISKDLEQYCEKKADAHAKIVEALVAEEATKNRKVAAAFLEDLKNKNKNNTEFGVLPSSVCYEIIKPGNDKKPSMNDSVQVNYRGTLIDGQVFDSSYKSGKPVTFPMNGVIPGFSAGLCLLGEGGKARLYIPSSQAYGDRPMGDLIPAGSLLIFDVELLQVVPDAFQKMGQAVPSLK